MPEIPESKRLSERTAPVSLRYIANGQPRRASRSRQLGSPQLPLLLPLAAFGSYTLFAEREVNRYPMV